MTIHLTPAENGWIIDLPKVSEGKPATQVKHVATSTLMTLEIVAKAMHEEEARRAAEKEEKP